MSTCFCKSAGKATQQAIIRKSRVIWSKELSLRSILPHWEKKKKKVWQPASVMLFLGRQTGETLGLAHQTARLNEGPGPRSVRDPGRRANVESGW